MGGIGTTQPQIWLRGEPDSNRVRGLITVRDGRTDVRTTAVSTTGAYNDGQWHHLVLRRGGEQLTLFIDGTQSTVADVSGSVSRNSPFGVHIGQRMDSRAFFTGAIDEVHVWDRALTDTELSDPKALRSTADTVLWLPLDHVSGGH
jgi:sialidase-1